MSVELVLDRELIPAGDDGVFKLYEPGAASAHLLLGDVGVQVSIEDVFDGLEAADEAIYYAWEIVVS